MKKLKSLFALGITLVQAGVYILSGVSIYEAFQKNLKFGVEMIGWWLLIFGIALAVICLLIVPADCQKKE